MRWIIALLAAMSLAGCAKTETGCSHEVATRNVLEIITDALLQKVQARINGGDTSSTDSVTPSAVRAEINKLKFEIDNIRTTLSSDSSTSKTCEATINVHVPVDVLNSANQARSLENLNSVRELADFQGLLGSGGSFSADLKYTVQPTDNGEKIYTEMDGDSPIVMFLTEVLSNDLVSGLIARQKQEELLAAQRQEQEQAAGTEAQRKADLELATAEYKLTIQIINAQWQAIDPLTRKQLLPIQRAWISKTKADCRVEAAGESIDPTERETARLNCEALRNRSRSDELGRLAGGRGSAYSESNDAALDAAADAAAAAREAARY